MKSSKGWILAVVAVFLMIVCCVAVAVILFSGLYTISKTIIEDPGVIETLLPASATATVESTIIVKVEPVQPEALINLERLHETKVNAKDPVLLAYQFGLVDVMQNSRVEAPKHYQVGDRKTFWAFNNDTNIPYQQVAKLGCEREHLYFWIGEDVKYNEGELQTLCDAFETKIFPTNRAFFGSEWSPGVDNDPHIYVLFAKGMGSIGGYFSSSDEYLPEVQQYSNAHEIIFMSADYNSLASDYTYGVIAHEYQHMIHYYQDMNEDGWINEGFSELAALLNGYDPGGMDYVFLNNPDWQLNWWPTDSSQTRPSYGAAFLFVTYIMERFGEEVTMELVQAPENGFAGVDAVFAENDIQNDDSGTILTAEDIFADWAVTNYLNDSSIEDGKYAYTYYTQAGTAGPTEVLDTCISSWQDRSVAQFGTDYVSISCSKPFRFVLEGSSMVNLLPVDPYSGSFAFWSNTGNDSRMTLTQQFDLSDVSSPVSMTYQAWFDIEQDYDYLYVEASVDNEHWDILKTESGTDLNPSGNSYGWGYSGKSGIWQQESVDLSAYAGKKVFVRFEYITDPAVNGEGFLVDNISIPYLGYFTDFEKDEGGWVGDGFVRVSNQLPQTFRVSVIQLGENITVEKHDVNSTDPLIITSDTKASGETVIVISGTTRFTRTPAAYRFKIMEE